ncbi:hypothetical protein QU24_07615 [Pantoea rodasii]|uniref:Uncharacterized protein n=2 Tax=Pantoea TaxID=53335 RepID=A0A0U3VA37_9GAMM|nr:hypothetical protein LK04_04455 [Pantoea vagans]KHJ68617.1 hypothetical protein QU24_07615 [Pantoea rodasii]
MEELAHICTPKAVTVSWVIIEARIVSQIRITSGHGNSVQAGFLVKDEGVAEMCVSQQFVQNDGSYR